MIEIKNDSDYHYKKISADKMRETIAQQEADPIDHYPSFAHLCEMRDAALRASKAKLEELEAALKRYEEAAPAVHE